jgi:hypothetical protein
MGRAPDGIRVGRHHDLTGREWYVWLPRGLFLIPTGIVLLALANVFGQHPSTSLARSSQASVSLSAPTRVRGGLLWGAKFDIHARTTLDDARLVLASTWLEGMTVNTIEPSPADETSRDGALELDLGTIPAGQDHVLFIQFQTNPTTIGRRDTPITLMDDDVRVLSIDRTMTVYP